MTRLRRGRAGHHITAKGMNSVTLCSLVHKFIPMPQALKSPDAKGGSGERSDRRSKE